MRFTLHKDHPPSQYWNGLKPLPDEIHVMSYHPSMSEFELLSVICTLHGYVTAFDLLTGSDSETEKDKDMVSVLTAFQYYIHPKMPLSHYTHKESRVKGITP